MFEALMLVSGVLSSFLIGVFVVTRSPRKKVNQLYGILTICFVLLLIFNFLSLHAVNNTIWYIRLVLLVSTLASFFQLFLIIYINKRENELLTDNVTGLLIGATIITSVVDITPFSFIDVNAEGVPRAAQGIILFVIHFIVFLAWSIGLLVISIKNSTGIERKRHLLMFLGLMPILTLVPITAIILPIVFLNKAYISITPVYIVFYLIMIAYAIIRHGLFDIRLAAVRAATYLLSLATLSAVYISVAYVISKLILNDPVVSHQMTSPVNVGIGLLMAFIFQPVKRFFDKVTNNIFYREDYDERRFLNTFSDLIIQQETLSGLSRVCLRAIDDCIKTNNILLVLDEVNGKGLYSLIKNTDAHEDAIRKLIKDHTNDDTLVVSELRNEEIQDNFIKNNIEIIIPLKNRNETIGHLVLSEKKDGNLYRSKDINALKLASKELAVAIQNVMRLEEINLFNSTLQEKVDNATRKLRATNTKLKMLDETKDDFMSMASHQLRTPLTSIKGYLSMLLEGDMGEVTPAQRKALEEAYGSSQRMVYLIGDFLNLSRLRTGRFELETSSVLLPTIIHQEIAQLRAIAHSRNVRLTYDSPIKFPSTIADETKIRQVMMNFIDNAIYYSKPDGGKVTVTLEVEKDDAVFTVVDSGIGVGEAEQSHLFTKFYRTPSARKARPDGTGVGLFMAKKVIDAHHGSIIFKSRENVGSTFGFRLPILDKK